MNGTKRPVRRRNPRGRPPKFQEPSRPVTVTLPDRTIETLSRLGDDRARSIVLVTDAFAAEQGLPRPAVEIVTVGVGLAVILTGRCPALTAIEGLTPVEINPGRFLLTVAPGMPAETLEVEIADLASESGTSAEERAVLEGLVAVLRSQRRRRSLSKAEILFVEPV